MKNYLDVFKINKLAVEYGVMSYKDILKQLSNSKSFAESLRICKDNFARLGSGSARIVFIVLGDVVLKLAKNSKGLAQNRIEADGFIASSELANAPIDSDPNDKWILCRLAKKMNKSKFQNLTMLDWDDFCNALTYWDAEFNGRKSFIKMDENKYSEIKENNFFQEITDLIGNMGLAIGDLMRVNSYGEIDGKIKIIDLGLTNDLYESMYK